MAANITTTHPKPFQYLSVRNWDRWQTWRRDRGSPPWIKVHRRIMRDPNWVALTDAQKGQLVAIWMLAADRNGVVPASPSLIKQLCCLECEPDLPSLIELGFLDAKAAPRRRQPCAKETPSGRQLVTLETETETETETDKIVVAPSSTPLPVKQNGEKKNGQPRKGVKTRISDDWRPNQSSISDAIALGFTEGEVTREAQKFRNHARQNERMVIRWDSAFDNWMIKAAEFANKQPPEPTRTFYPALPGSPEFQAWRTFWMDSGNPMVRELKQREIEGRAFKFEAQWPPGFGQ